MLNPLGEPIGGRARTRKKQVLSPAANARASFSLLRMEINEDYWKFWGDPVNWVKNSMTPEGYLSNGPYPYRGRYLEVFRFEKVPDPGLLLFAARQSMIANT